MSTARFLAKCHTFLEMSRFSKYVSFLVSRKVSSPVFLECLVSNEMHVVCHAVTLVSHISLDTNFLLRDVTRFSKDVFPFQRRISCFLQVLAMFRRRCFLHLTMIGCIFDKTSFVPQ